MIKFSNILALLREWLIDGMFKYKMSRYWNKLILSFMLFLLKRGVWDQTGKNDNWIQDTKLSIIFLRSMIGYKQ